MSTMTKLGPADHGVALTYDEFMESDYEVGFRYELIDGRLFVSPMPDPPENDLDDWLSEALRAYMKSNAEVINRVCRARVFVPGRSRTTSPEPDIAVFEDYPHHLPLRKRRWQDVSPILVIEIMTGDHWKDLVRNAELYLQVPSIREYWVLDARDNPDEPTLIQHRRHGKRWVVREFPYGTKFTTKLLPGFSLTIDPMKS